MTDRVGFPKKEGTAITSLIQETEMSEREPSKINLIYHKAELGGCLGWHLVTRCALLHRSMLSIPFCRLSSFSRPRSMHICTQTPKSIDRFLNVIVYAVVWCSANVQNCKCSSLVH